MRLDDCGFALGRVVRDCEFCSLGFVSHRRPGLLAFLADERFAPALADNPDLAAVIASPALADRVPGHLGLALSDDPRRAFFDLHDHLARHTEFYGADRPSVVAPSARVHPAAHVAKENVVIGERVVVEPNATVFNRVVVEDDAIVRAGAVVGAEGFQFQRTGEGLLPVVHTGSVRLCRGAEIQSGACVDRAVFGGETVIGEDSRIDGLVFVAHDVRVGRRCRIVAHAVLCGSAVIGDDCWVGPGAVISSGVSVGRGARVSLGSVVTRDVPEGQTVSGHFAIDHESFLAFMRSVRGEGGKG
jgi:UDP-3-O-[3-hydroxymyristoyl] glucosamine N-acyltransferase